VVANRTFHDVEPESTTTIEPIHLKNKIAKSNMNIFNVVYRMIIMILSSIAIYDQLLKMFEEEKAALEKKR